MCSYAYPKLAEPTQQDAIRNALRGCGILAMRSVSLFGGNGTPDGSTSMGSRKLNSSCTGPNNARADNKNAWITPYRCKNKRLRDELSYSFIRMSRSNNFYHVPTRKSVSY